MNSRGVSLQVWMAEVWMVSPLSAAKSKKVNQMADPRGVWSISSLKRRCGLALVFTVLRKDCSPCRNLSHRDLGSVWSCTSAAGSLKQPLFPVLPGQPCGVALELSSHPSPGNIRAFSTCLCQSCQKSLLYLLLFL